MGRIKEQDFDRRNDKYPDYSHVEYDLYAKLGMSIVKNHKSGQFEIIKTKTREVIHKGTLQEMVDKANELEGAKNTWIA